MNSIEKEQLLNDLDLKINIVQMEYKSADLDMPDELIESIDIYREMKDNESASITEAKLLYDDIMGWLQSLRDIEETLGGL